MLQRLDTYIKAVWKRYALWGFVLIVVVTLAVLTWLQLVLGVDVSGYVNRLLGVS